jgi:hypothetical protein
MRRKTWERRATQKNLTKPQEHTHQDILRKTKRKTSQNQEKTQRQPEDILTKPKENDRKTYGTCGKHKERHGESQPQAPRSRLNMRGKAGHKEKPHETSGTHT